MSPAVNAAPLPAMAMFVGRLAGAHLTRPPLPIRHMTLALRIDICVLLGVITSSLNPSCPLLGTAILGPVNHRRRVR